MESGTRVEGLHRGRSGASNLLDTQDTAVPSRGGRVSIGVWVALAAGATIATAGLVDRRDDLAGWFRSAPSATAAAASALVVPPVTAPIAAPHPTGPTTPDNAANAANTATPGVAPVTVSVESLPVAAPSSVSIDELPRAVAAPSAPATHRRPRRH